MMKYRIMSAAVIGVMMATTANAAPKISGQIKPILLAETVKNHETNLENGTVRSGEKDRPEFINDSRIRVSGNEKINDNVSFSYSLEYNIILDGEDDRNWVPRSTYLGLEHKKYGRIRAGRLSLPGGDDLDIVNMASGYAWGTDEPFSFTGDTRTDNAFQYTSPKFGKDGKNRIKLHYGIDEGDTKFAGRFYSFNNANNRRTSKNRDVAQIDFLHADEKLTYGLYYTQAGDDFKAARGAVRYDIPDGKFGFGLTAQSSDFGSDDNEVGAMGSVSYYYNDDIMFYAQAGHADNYQGYADGKRSVFSIGGSKNKKLSSGMLTAFASVSYDKTTEIRNASSDDVADGIADRRYQLISSDSKALGVEAGLLFKF